MTRILLTLTVLAATVAAVAATGFASSGTQVVKVSTAAVQREAISDAPMCQLMEPGFNLAWRICTEPGHPGRHGYFTFRGKRVPIAAPTRTPAGHWAAGYLRPGGKTLLLQWFAECEVPFAFFVPARGGTPTLVTGGRDLSRARPSVAHGWQWDGKSAIIELITGCGKPHARSELRLVRAP